MADAPHPPGSGGADDDAALVTRARAAPHDTAAFDILAARHLPWLVRLCAQLTGDAADAEDLAQEAMVRAWLSLGQLTDPARFGAWVRSIARNLCVDAMRRRARIQPTTVLDQPTEEGTHDAAEDWIVLRQALRRLDAGEREVLALRAAGASWAEVAELQRATVSAVKMRAARALARLRQTLRTDDP